MGKYFILLMIAIIVFMGGLGWIVLGQEKSPSSQDTADVNLKKLDQAGLLQVAFEASSPQRLEAVLQLLEIEREISTLVPALAKLTRDRNELVTIAAGIVFKEIGPQGAEHLRSMIESADVTQMEDACSALKEMGGANLYSSLMEKWLVANDSMSRKRALYALQGSSEGVLELLEPITETFTDPDFNVQCMACRVLVSLGPDAIDATEKVLELHRAGNPSARSWAALTLGSIGPNTQLDTAQFLAGNLDAFMQIEKKRTLMGLAKLGPEALSVAEQVREVMHDKHKRVMPDAAFALWRITGETAETFPVLTAALDDPSDVDDTLALVGQMGEAAKPLVVNLVRLLKVEKESPLESAVIALGNIGPAASEALPKLREIADNRELDALNRFYIREAIKKISAKK